MELRCLSQGCKEEASIHMGQSPGPTHECIPSKYSEEYLVGTYQKTQEGSIFFSVWHN